MSDRQLLFDRPVPNGWRVLKVDALKADEPSSCAAGPFGSNISSKYFVDEGIPVIRGSSLRDDLTRFVPKGFVFVSPERAKEYKGQHVRAGDLVFTCWGTLGQVGLIPENGPFPEYIISNKQLKLRPNRTLADPLYLFYYFACPEMVKYIQSIAIGAAVPGINLGILKNLDVVLPPLTVQHKIVSLLSAYDDLIENNTRRIAILEAMVQTIYREWFVEFRFPGHEKVKLVDSPLGKIPEGWKATCLGDLAEDVRRSIDPSQVDPDTPYFGLEHLPRKSITLAEWGKAKDVQSTKLSFRQGEILFGKIRPYFHKVGVAPVDGVCSSDAIVISPKTTNAFGPVLCCVSSEAFVSHATQTSQGTKMPRANWGVLVKYPLPIPQEPLLERFNESIRDIVRTLRLLLLKNRNLRTTRDLLLPKLISGQLDVEDLDIETAEAVTMTE
jgi:type I restriction enzyme S subunit